MTVDDRRAQRIIESLRSRVRRLLNATSRPAGFLQPAEVQSAHRLHTSVLHAFGFTAATGFGIEPDCGRLPGVLR